MTATPSPKGVEPPPKSAIEEIIKRINNPCCEDAIHEMWVEGLVDRAAAELATLTAERDEAQKERDELKTERDELANWIKRIHGQAEAAQAALHGGRLEVDLGITKKGE